MLRKLATQRTVRTTTAQLEYNDEETGAIKQEQVVVQYYSPTIEQLQNEQEDIRRKFKKDPNAVHWTHESLANRLHALTDSSGERIEKKELSAEFLRGFDLKNLQAIREAIENDLRPKSEGTT
jgi:hypothetical protein